MNHPGAGRTRATRAHRRSPARAALVVVAAILVASGCTDGSDGSDDPATSPEPSPSAAAGNGHPAPTRATGPAGSVADAEGDPPPTPEPSADLRAAEVALDGDAVHARLTLDGPPPAETASLLWALELHVDGERAYTVTVQQIEDERMAAVFDWSEREQSPLDEPPDIDGGEMSLRVPLELVPEAADGFAWLAHTELEGAWEDWLPADREPVVVRP